MPKRVVTTGSKADETPTKKSKTGGRSVQWQTVGALGAGTGTVIRGLIPSDGLCEINPESYQSVEGTAFRGSVMCISGKTDCESAGAR